jgi:hypothetical protein
MAQISCKTNTRRDQGNRETSLDVPRLCGVQERAVGIGRQAHHPSTNDIEYTVASWTCTDLSEDEGQEVVRAAHGLSSGCIE